MAVVPVCFGIAFTATLLNQAEALVHVYTDGSVVVTTGAVEMGQGVHGKIRRAVALTLGIAEARVRAANTNTLRVANLSPTAASTGADLNGAAARQACVTILDGLRPVAAALLDCPPGVIYLADGHATGAGRSVSWEALVTAAYQQRTSLSALAHYGTPGLHFDPRTNTGEPFAYHVYGAALVEAEVDVLLGTGAITAVTAVHDVGASIDLATDIGQIEGALVQGLGWMTSEEICRDDQGHLLSDSLASYKIPDLDAAPPIDVVLLPSAGDGSLLNSKAVGEPPLIYGLGAFFALRAAIQAWREEHCLPLGAAVAPLTPERIFTLLHGEV